jgi:hypothetical protein
VSQWEISNTLAASLVGAGKSKEQPPAANAQSSSLSFF